LDEPFSNLDAKSREAHAHQRPSILQKTSHIAMLFVTPIKSTLSLFESHRLDELRRRASQQGDPRLHLRRTASTLIRARLRRQTLFVQRQSANAAIHRAKWPFALAGARDCIVFGRCYKSRAA